YRFMRSLILISTVFPYTTLFRSALIMDEFFLKKDSVILTSATLTINNSFSFIQNRLGLINEEVNLKKIRSPFKYDQQAQLLIPRSEEHTSELQSREKLVCRLLLE